MRVLWEGATVSIIAAARLLATLILGALDRMLGTDPRDVTWVPEARVDEGQRWEG